MWKQKGNVYGERDPKDRRHKGKRFYPERISNRRKTLYQYLIHQKTREGISWGDAYHYRIYKLRRRGFALYIGPSKISHGGIRHRPTRKMHIAKQRRKYIRMTGQQP